MTSQLPTRTLGSLTVSAIGLGCMNLSHAYLPRPDPAQAERLLLHALDSGVTLFDTAAVYGMGANEELIGRTLMHRRSEFTLSSKCVLAAVDGTRMLDGSPRTIARVLEDSLRRLCVDHIDLYYLHRLDRRVPIEESVGALARAVEAGKIGAIGLSEMSAATLRRAHAVHPIAAMQTEYAPWTRNAELAVLDACAQLGVGFVAFSPLGRGLLAGGVGPHGVAQEDIRAAMPRSRRRTLPPTSLLRPSWRNWRGKQAARRRNCASAGPWRGGPSSSPFPARPASPISTRICGALRSPCRTICSPRSTPSSRSKRPPAPAMTRRCRR